MMELNGRSPFLWDLENLVMFNTKDGETPKTLQLVESEIEGIEAFELGSFYSSGGVSDGGTGTGSDLGYTSSSRSSKSGSDYSSTDRGIKETKFSLETNDCFQQDLGKKREFVQSIESSAVSGESLTALELCNRTYFEDTAKASSVPTDFSVKKSKSSSMSLEVPRCQVEGCNVDLSSAKDYHRKHKVCETHSKCPRVVINGHERRFCQQCSRFHSITEFDHKKRSCRRRLSDHNARRRKPKPEIIQFNSMGMASSLYEGGNQLNFGFDQAPMIQTRPGTWDSSRNSKHTQAKSGVITSANGGSNGIMQYTHNGLQIPVTKVPPVSNHFVPSKGSPPEIYHRGLATSVAPTNMNTAQNLGALSLLSTSSWGSGNQNPSPLDHPVMQSNNPSVATMHTVHPGGPPVSSEFWTPSFQLFKAPNESSFYLY